MAAAVTEPGTALPAQWRLTTVAAAVEQHGISGVKAAAAMIGLQPGSVRCPLVASSPAAIEAIRAALVAAAII